MLTGIWQDIRYGVRMLLKSPGFTAAAVLSLALGVGANTAVFSLIDAILWNRLDVPEPERLVILGPGEQRGISITDTPFVEKFSYPRYRALQRSTGDVAELAAVSSMDPLVYVRRGAEGSPQAARVRLVSGRYFSTLGATSSLGRVIGPEDNRSPGGHPVVVLNHRYWLKRFGGEEGAIGEDIIIQDRAFTVIGVAAPGFHGERLGSSPAMWAPLMMQAEIMRDESFLERPEVSFLQALGRLAPGVPIEQAEASLASRWRAILLEEAGGAPSDAWMRGVEIARLTLRSGARGYSGVASLQDPLTLLFVVTVIVLLVACSNVANLLLARATARRREMGVRVALGANRGRLFRQVLTESLLLAGMAGASALLIAQWFRDALLAMAPVNAASLDLTLDWRILAFTAAIAVATGVLFGSVPAWRAGRPDIVNEVRSGSRGTLEGGRLGLQGALVAGQTALSLVLLFGAGLLLESLEKLSAAETGFATESLLAARVDPRGAGFDDPDAPRLCRRILESVGAVPGVRSAAMALDPVITGSLHSQTVEVPGYEPGADEDMDARIFAVTPEYFETVGTPLLAGRGFDAQDSEGAPVAAIVDEALARRFFASREAVGGLIRLMGGDLEAQIVGVAAEAKINGVRDAPRPTIYLSAYAFPQVLRGVLIRADGDPGSLATAVRAAIERAEPRLPINSIDTIETRLHGQLRSERLLVWMTSGFGALALALACVGLYGVVSYRVARRTSEMGLRMAMGARGRDLLGLVLREGLILAGGGVLIGALFAPLAGRWMESLLYETSAWNAMRLLGAAALLLVAGIAAGLPPALGAARLDPLEALRHD